MLFGCCVGVVGEGGKLNTERLDVIKNLGFDFVELGAAQVAALEDEDFAQLKNKLQALSLRCLCMNGFLPGSVRLTGPQADLDAAIVYVRKAAQRMAALGTQTVVMGSSVARNVPAGTSMGQAMDQLAVFLDKAADVLEPLGITLALEPLNRQESNILNRVSEGVALARRVNRKGIQVLVDTFHLNLSYEPLTNILDAAPYLRHVHIANVLGRSMPSLDAQENLPEIFACLKRIGYDGTISLEASVKGDLAQEAAAALHCLRTLHTAS